MGRKVVKQQAVAAELAAKIAIAAKLQELVNSLNTVLMEASTAKLETTISVEQNEGLDMRWLEVSARVDLPLIV